MVAQEFQYAPIYMIGSSLIVRLRPHFNTLCFSPQKPARLVINCNFIALSFSVFSCVTTLKQQTCESHKDKCFYSD